jgi:ferric-dicitrate binding protein FerR (iron transport regulator)
MPVIEAAENHLIFFPSLILLNCWRVLFYPKQNVVDKNFKIAQIIARSFFGTLTAGEKQLLEQWRSQSVKNESLYNELSDPQSAKAAFEQINHFKKDQEQKQMSWQKRKTVHLSVYLARASAAAAILLLVILSGIMLHRYSRNQLINDSTQSKISILPGRPGALLTLSSGEKIVLNDQMNDSAVLADDNSHVAFISGKQISYRQQTDPGKEKDLTDGAELVYNMLEVPIKAEYHIILEDGTRVALNAGSSLRYPVRFGRSIRRVEVSGEAFFDVAHEEGRPFEVVDGFGNRIEDIGTSFNVKAYPDDAEHMVVLVEGEIIFHPETGGDKRLDPGFGVVYRSTEPDPVITPVDVNEITAWKEGRFIFNDKPLTYIFSNISRWYGIELEPVDAKAGLLHFTVDIPKYENLATIISILESTGSINFKQEGEKIKAHLNKAGRN